MKKIVLVALSIFASTQVFAHYNKDYKALPVEDKIRKDYKALPVDDTKKEFHALPVYGSDKEYHALPVEDRLSIRKGRRTVAVK